MLDRGWKELAQGVVRDGVKWECLDIGMKVSREGELKRNGV